MSLLLEALRTRSPLPAFAAALAVAQHHYLGTIATPPAFRAAVGRRRTFLSLSDVQAYEQGWRDYPCVCPDQVGTPRSDGYFDHESLAFDRAAA